MNRSAHPARGERPQGEHPQQQKQLPGSEARMRPQPVTISDHYRGAGKLRGKIALIAGGDSGIGRAVAVHFAREGADLAVMYLGSVAHSLIAATEVVVTQGQAPAAPLGDSKPAAGNAALRHNGPVPKGCARNSAPRRCGPWPWNHQGLRPAPGRALFLAATQRPGNGQQTLDEDEDAIETRRQVEAEGQRCLLLPGDARDERHCRSCIDRTLAAYGHLDVLVNHLGGQWPQDRLEDIDSTQLRRSFETNVYPYFYLTRHALPHLHAGASIINTASVVSYRGHRELVDYAATKGAIRAMTYSLASQLAPRSIRVNGVAPGPIWTPLIVASFDDEQIQAFGDSSLLKRAGQPAELAPAYVYLACADSSYVTGQFLHVNGGSYLGA